MDKLRIVLILILCSSVVHTFQWSYKDQHRWPGICTTGENQSPIDLDVKYAEVANFPKFVFNLYNIGYPAVVKNNGHTLTINISAPYPSVSGGGLPLAEYVLDHVHFHWQAEHILNSIRYPLELHAVHRGKEFKDLQEAIKHKGGVAVFGVFFDFSPDEDEEISQLTEIIKNVMQSTATGVSHMEGVRAKSFFPRDTAGFFRYDGSLTSPDCNEGVIWTVFTHIISISEAQVKKFLSVELEGGNVKQNSRVTQKTGTRQVYLKESPLHRDAAATLSYNKFFMVSIWIIFQILQKY